MKHWILGGTAILGALLIWFIVGFVAYHFISKWW